MPTEIPIAEKVRTFDTGATRDLDDNKYDYEGFLSPLVIEAFGAYMHKHRIQPDGKLRDSDNWQKGIPRAAYMKSLWRHLVQVWKLHRGLACKDEKGNPVTMVDALMAVLFNAGGYAHELLSGAQKFQANDDFLRRLQAAQPVGLSGTYSPLSGIYSPMSAQKPLAGSQHVGGSHPR